MQRVCVETLGGLRTSPEHDTQVGKTEIIRNFLTKSGVVEVKQVVASDEMSTSKSQVEKI